MKISILGSTGSIGTQTLDVCRGLPDVEITALSTNENIALLEKQIQEFNPKIVAVVNEAAAENLRQKVNNRVKIISGPDALRVIAAEVPADTVVTAVVGTSGLLPTLDAIDAGKNIALANKETLVSAGELVMKKANAKNVHIFPIDSEHSAILQCMDAYRDNQQDKGLAKILLTASGGPFRGKKKAELEKVTAADALKHPNWHMGKKITIDTATLMNKGLEFIEAKHLFQVSLAQIEVLVHPQSIIHSMVEFHDGAIMAQLGMPDMRIPIQYALVYPKRLQNHFPKLDLLEKSTLTFEKPDEETFRCLALAKTAIQKGGVYPAILNAANEAAVNLFLTEKIGFLDIPLLIERAMLAYTDSDTLLSSEKQINIDAVLKADLWAREYIQGCLQ